MEGVNRIDQVLKERYSQMEKSEYWKMVRFGCGHIETMDMRKELCEFIQKYL
jgi:hypothetical protein